MYLSKVKVFPLDDEVLMFFWLLSIFRQMTMYLESRFESCKSLTLTKDKTKRKNLGMKLNSANQAS